MSTESVQAKALREAREFVMGLPLLECEAIKRLANVTFLGLLSPTFHEKLEGPLKNFSGKPDGSRLDHSIEVAALTVAICKSWAPQNLKLQLYAAAWGLLHDVATWPLSHSGEPAFTLLTGISSRELRSRMITGDALPEGLRVDKALAAMDIDPSLLQSFFDKNASGHDQFENLRKLIHAPYTPDTLEGMARTGAVLGIDVARPEDWIITFTGELFPFILAGDNVKQLDKFWKAKQKIYQKTINQSKVIKWESTWSSLIAKAYPMISLEESLSLKESDIVQCILNALAASGEKMRKKDAVQIFRYKEPLRYYVDIKAHGDARFVKSALPKKPKTASAS